MSYSYANMKPKLMTDDGIRSIIATLDEARWLVGRAGCVRAGRILQCGDSWESMAAVEWLVEAGFLQEISTSASWQDRVLQT